MKFFVFASLALAVVFALTISSTANAQAIKYGATTEAEAPKDDDPTVAPPISSFTFRVIEEDKHGKKSVTVYDGSEKHAGEIIKQSLAPETKALEIEQSMVGPMNSGLSDYVIREIDDESLEVLKQMLKDSARAETVLRTQLTLGVVEGETLDVIKDDLGRLHRHKMAITARLGKLKEVNKSTSTPTFTFEDGSGMPASAWILLVGCSVALGLVGRQIYGAVKPHMKTWNQNRLRIKDAKLRQKLDNLSPDSDDSESEEEESESEESEEEEEEETPPPRRRRRRRRKKKADTADAADADPETGEATEK